MFLTSFLLHIFWILDLKLRSRDLLISSCIHVSIWKLLIFSSFQCWRNVLQVLCPGWSSLCRWAEAASILISSLFLPGVFTFLSLHLRQHRQHHHHHQASTLIIIKPDQFSLPLRSVHVSLYLPSPYVSIFVITIPVLEINLNPPTIESQSCKNQVNSGLYGSF